MNKKFLMNVAIFSIAGVLYGSSSSSAPAIDDEAIVLAHAANAVYNITSKSDTLPALNGWEIIKFQKADDNHLIQAVAFKKEKQVIISYRGTTCTQDWMANLGIGYAQSYMTQEPIVEHLIASFTPCITYHGLHPREAVNGFFGMDLLGGILSNATSAVSPFYSFKSGVSNVTSAITDKASSAIEFAKEHKASTGLGTAVVASAVVYSSPFWASWGTLLTAGATLVAAPVNGIYHTVRTGCGVAKSQIGGMSSNAASQQQLIFDISRQNNHPYAAYLAEVNAFTNDLFKSDGFPEDGAVITTTGHSLGAHLGTASFLVLNNSGIGGSIQGCSSTTFARPNGFGGICRALYDMRASASLQSVFSDQTELKKTRVFSHEHDIVARIGHNNEGLGNLFFLPTPPHTAYQRGRLAPAITIHHGMGGLVKTLTKSHEDEDADQSDSKKNK